MEDLLDKCVDIVRKAGQAVMEVYESQNFDVTFKRDKSPLTRADTLANQIIEAGLKKTSGFPIISEEGSHNANADQFWLVDPVDGTKEFIKRNGEFTINIGLVKKGEPILGVVYAPAKELLYAGSKTAGAFKVGKRGLRQPIEAVYRTKVPTVAVGHSHLNIEAGQFINKLGQHKLIKLGSSLKLCYVAEGKVSMYPRFIPSYLWDTAAGDAIVRSAGGLVADLDGRKLTYNPKHLLNPFFVATTKNVSL